jgi:cytochrome b
MPPPGFNDRVWDMPVRVTHWVLAATALGAYFVPAVPLNAHAFLGYAALTAVAIRIAWGFVGSEYARFTNFVPGMRALIAYLHALARRREPRMAGHNPAGAVMILLLLALMLVLGVTGWMISQPAWRDWRLLEDVHILVAHLLMLAACMHVLGVVYTSVRHRENLIWAMITGRKRRE